MPLIFHAADAAAAIAAAIATSFLLLMLPYALLFDFL